MFNYKNAEIFQVKICNAVQFDKAYHSYFNKNDIKKHKNLKIEIIPELQMVYIASDKDEILVGFTNIEAIHLNSEVRKENTNLQLAERAKKPVANRVKKAK